MWPTSRRPKNAPIVLLVHPMCTLPLFYTSCLRFVSDTIEHATGDCSSSGLSLLSSYHFVLSSSVSTVNTELCSQRFSSALTASSSLFSHSHQGSTPLFQLLSWVAHSSQVPQTGTGGQRRGDEVVLPFPGRLHHLPPLRSTRAPFHFHACYPCTDS